MEIKINVKCIGKGEVNLEVSCNTEEAAIMKDLLSEQLRWDEQHKRCDERTKKFDGDLRKPWRK